MDNKEIEAIADSIMKERQLATLRRYKIDYNVDLVMQVIKTIGNRLCHGRFVIDSENTKVYVEALNWLFGMPFEAIDPVTGKAMQGNLHKGLYIAGNCGTGKSLMMVLLAGIAKYGKIKFEFNGEDRSLCWKEQRADEICNKFIIEGSDTVKKAIDTDVLCINDLASEPAEQMYMGNRVSVMRQILEARADHYGKLTLITSNYPINHERITEWYGDRVSSRLMGMCNYLILNGKDRRL